MVNRRFLERKKFGVNGKEGYTLIADYLIKGLNGL